LFWKIRQYLLRCSNLNPWIYSGKNITVACDSFIPLKANKNIWTWKPLDVFDCYVSLSDK
jgi:hypothetical protein